MSEKASDWVLLRGLTRESRHWGGFPELMASRLGCRVHCIDLPGNGRLNDVASPLSVEGFADGCHAALARLAIARPSHVLAMSLGAMVTVAWAHRHPADIAGAVLVNTSLRPYSPFFKRLRPSCYPRLLRLLALPTSAEQIERTILGLTSTLRGDDGAGTARLLAEWVRWRTENPVSRRNLLAQLLAALRFCAPPTPPLKALLLLTSQRDGLVDPECSARLSKQWQTPLHIHPAAGHDLPLDDGDWVLARIEEWLEEHGQAGLG